MLPELNQNKMQEANITQQDLIDKCSKYVNDTQNKLVSFLIKETDESAIVKGKLLNVVELLRKYFCVMNELAIKLKATKITSNPLNNSDLESIKIVCPQCGHSWFMQINLLLESKDHILRSICEQCNHSWFINFKSLYNNITYNKEHND